MSVQKIDNSDKFDAIISNIKTEQELRDAASKIVWSNYKLFKNDLNIKDNNEELEWVKEKYKELITNCFKNNPESTTRIRLEALANLFLLIDKKDFKQVAKSLFLKSKMIQKNIDDNKADQDYSENEINAKIDFNDLEELRDSYKDKEGYKNEMIYLILCLNTYLPPLRLEYLNSNDREAIMFGNTDLTKNFIEDKPEGKDNMELHIGNDKVVNKIGPTKLLFANYKSKNGSIPIQGNIVREILRKSYWKNPRQYVITSLSDFTKPMSVSSYYKLLKTITGHIVNQNAIRKSYINYWYDQDKKLTRNDKIIISKYMRNSPEIAEAIYKKV